MAQHLDAERNRRVNAWIKEKWVGGSNCPICRENQWEIGDLGKIYVDDTIRRRAYPVIPLICGNCGYMLLINALTSGIFDAADLVAIENQQQESLFEDYPGEAELYPEGAG